MGEHSDQKVCKPLKVREKSLFVIIERTKGGWREPAWPSEIKGSRCWRGDQRLRYLEATLCSGGAVCSPRLRVDRSSGARRKERNFTKVGLSSTMF